jgi:hypothetical protein
MGGHTATLIRTFGTTDVAGVPLRLVGAYQADDGSPPQSVEIYLGGRFTEIDLGKSKAGDDTEHKYTLPLSYYRRVVDGVDEVEIDMLGPVPRRRCRSLCRDHGYPHRLIAFHQNGIITSPQRGQQSDTLSRCVPSFLLGTHKAWTNFPHFVPGHPVPRDRHAKPAHRIHRRSCWATSEGVVLNATPSEGTASAKIFALTDRPVPIRP